jgi:hypothetical protein
MTPFKMRFERYINNIHRSLFHRVIELRRMLQISARAQKRVGMTLKVWVGWAKQTPVHNCVV